jgi:hypothetical protein
MKIKKLFAILMNNHIQANLLESPIKVYTRSYNISEADGGQSKIPLVENRLFWGLWSLYISLKVKKGLQWHTGTVG